MALYGLLGIVAATTLTDTKVRAVTLGLLAMFAVRTWLHHRRQVIADNEDRDGK